MTDIHIQNLTKRFGGTVALRDISIDFPAGSFTSLLGPSGCGKTTLLRLIAGFEAPDNGAIHFGEDLIADAHRQKTPEERGVGVVFQSYALWPHMNVAENVAYPLKTRKIAKGEIAQRVEAVLESVSLGGFADRRIEELSGGQRQRVALARCLVADAKIILFDEPLANLDMHLRASMIEAFRDIHRRTRATIVYVTHDQSEALALSDRIAVMSAGNILQIASPTEVYHSPADRRVAGFIGRGTPVSGTVVEKQESSALVDVAGYRLLARGTANGSDAVSLLLRPEALSLADAGLAANVQESTYRGAVYETRLELANGERLTLDSASSLQPGKTVHVAIADAWIIPG
ncbi:ABC transporter ATP-binding protein [Phyllobacterium myrsinacearum]|uniref:Iron(III) transport system ATP-binding protein n=1 Tax=Phyllobacterium myrsinacearum TaxID=28101 RepID=A0A839EME4_9HYPH|nr:ABC transporter ATP-binding protein [Phyllobacterium myrsinacearum]MBA8880012.1 iron(III) transport system ATP-binding protein [Phyllobacterium myrsinacearum]